MPTPSPEDRTSKAWSVRLRAIGGSLNITIPKSFVRAYGLQAGKDIILTWSSDEPDILKIHGR